MQQNNRNKIMEIAFSIFKIQEADLDTSYSPIDYDLDSLKVVKFVRRVNAHFEVDVKMSQIFGVDDFESIFVLFETAIQQKLVNQI